MAIRKKLNHDDKTRAKIRTSQLINRLMDHAFGKCEMTQTQISAALGLIKKTLPDLQAIEMKANIETTQRVISSEPISESEWEARHGNSLEAPTRPTKSIN